MRYWLIALLLIGCSVPQGAMVSFSPIEIAPTKMSEPPAVKRQQVATVRTCLAYYHDESTEILAKLECLRTFP